MRGDESTKRGTVARGGSRDSPRRFGDGLGAPRHKLRTIWQTSLDALLVVDDERRYTRVNEPAIRLLGAPSERVLTRRIDHFTPQEHWTVLEKLWDELRREGTQDGHYEVLRGDGSRVMVEYRARWGFGPGEHLIVARELGTREERTCGPGPWGALASAALSPRELEVVQMAADGRSSREIADAFVVSPSTIKTHFHNVYTKLGVPDRAAAVAECLRRRLIE